MSKKVYFLLTETGTLLSETIKLYTKAKYNHVSLGLDHELRQLYSFGRKNPINPLDGGFVHEDFERGTYSWHPHTLGALYELAVSDEVYKNIEQVITEFQKQRDKYLYNFIGLFGVCLNTPLEIDSAYFCSQFVSEVLNRSGLSLFDKPSGLVTPEDFYKLKQTTPIYEGRIYEYEPIKQRLARNPYEYHSFPFRKYVWQQISIEGKNEEPSLSFRDGFLKPKKVFVDTNLKKMKKRK